MNKKSILQVSYGIRGLTEVLHQASGGQVPDPHLPELRQDLRPEGYEFPPSLSSIEISQGAGGKIQFSMKLYFDAGIADFSQARAFLREQALQLKEELGI